MQRFAVDSAQAERVHQLAAALWSQLRPGGASSQARRELQWAAQLHEVGCRIAHGDHHRHGAYILGHSDAAGFALPEMQRLAQLVLGQRGKLKKMETHLGNADTALALLCLRLAVALCHARRAPDVQGLTVAQQGQRMVLRTRAGWATALPQSAHLL